ncbi:tRNA lysidine(34) synthetase TilS [Flagellimonas meridianipacifica]|uniref:tRNA(Ile)-lysidine synthase n=1 Tax=Flagellimonas meridianipacifica TaxID=1080225 RepID=A0A2T0MB11_9FLAO|nr:tRNA lysidine(34) synthetase TilS [Allomuricauda pacifica]PRX54694.1 tRNA(Ile)-lysidine synthase [Allomuricauda pacifica]
MLEKFQRHIEVNFPIVNKKNLLIACSGGLDSVVLTHLCVQCNLNITLAHCNFKLRGAESDGDEIFVKQLAEELNVEYVSVVFDTLKEVTEHGGSVQMVARKLRYEWFETVLDERKLDYILTAHHADDALETFIINLSRVTGIDGLSGIPESNGKILRPLLPFSRQKILEYAKSKRLKWREDSSNSDSKYLRNKIRMDITPKLKELHPTFLNNFLMTQTFLSQSKTVLENRIKEVKEKVFKEKGDTVKVRIADLKALQPLEMYLYGLFKGYGFTEWDDVKSLLDAMSGKEIHSNTHRLLKDRDFLLLRPKQEKPEAIFFIDENKERIEAPIPLHIETTAEFEKLDGSIVFLDKEKLNYPLTLRKWKKGDYFYPLGMQGKKKLSKFFKDEKMDVFSKEAQWLLCSGEEIVWVIGKRADERFKIDGNTTQIVKITYLI